MNKNIESNASTHFGKTDLCSSLNYAWNSMYLKIWLNSEVINISNKDQVKEVTTRELSV